MVAKWTLDSLKNFSLINGTGHATHHKIPTLEEVMEVARGRIMVNLDKYSGYMDKAFEIINKTGTVDQVIFKGSEDVDNVFEQYGTLLDNIIYMPIISKDTPNLSDHVADFFTESRPVSFEVLYNQDGSPMFDVIKTIKGKDSRIWVNTLWELLCGKHNDDRVVDNPDISWGWVIDHGANIIQPDRPALLLEYLREKGLHD